MIRGSWRRMGIEFSISSRMAKKRIINDFWRVESSVDLLDE